MKNTAFLLVAAIIALVAVNVRADMKVVNDQVTKVGDDENRGEQVTYYKEKMARMDDPSGASTIIRLDKGVIWTLINEEKEYSEMSLEKMAETMEKMKEFLKIDKDMKKTDEEKKIGEYKCVKVVTNMSMMGSKMTFTSWVTKDIKMDPAMLKFAENAEKAFENIPVLKIAFGMVKDFTDEGYFPVLIEHKVEAFGQKQESTSTLKSVSYDKLDDSLFEIPEGFKKTESNPLGM